MSQMMSNDSDIATPSTSMKHLIVAAQAKREQAHSAALPHSVSIEKLRILFRLFPVLHQSEGVVQITVLHSNFHYIYISDSCNFKKTL